MPSPGGFASSQESIAVTSVTSTTFTATFAAAHEAGARVSAVPEDIQAAIKLMAAHWYNAREAVADRNMTEVPLAAQHLLAGNDYGHYP